MQGNVMLAVGTMPAAGGKLQYQELFYFTVGEGYGEPRLNLPFYLQLRARVQQHLPAVAALSEMQVLLLLAYATQPWPVDLTDSRVFGTDAYFGSPLHCVATQFKLVERMPGHPQAPPGAAEAQAAKRGFGRYGRYEEGVPGGMERDNSCNGDTSYRWHDGLPITIKLTKTFRGFFDEKFALVTQFHRGARR
jgi:hypothetical protein